jgi:predicted nuclease of restriction endonuclease-like (RecB) superfamily
MITNEDKSLSKNETGYFELLSYLKNRISDAQIRAAISVNKELIFLYWEIGKNIVEKQNREGWGSKVIDRLSRDLMKSFPDMKGFSPRNLKYMRKFAEENPNFEIVQEALAQLTWYHNITLMDKIGSPDERVWYARQAIKNGWSRNVLVHQIELGLYNRLGKTTNNFEVTLPKSQSDLARQTLKDPYIFDFLSVGEDAQERELEKELTKHITKFLLELGAGFSFVGSQYHLEVGNEDYYIDLLFYHLRLRCFVVIELKTGDFKPEYVGKINFYLSALDKQVKHPDDNSSIGIILCKSKNKITVEYALMDTTKPIGVSEYKIVESIPEKLKTSLPTIEQLEAEFTDTSEKIRKKK